MANPKKVSSPRQDIIELLNETIYPGSAEAITVCYGLKDGIKELRKYINGLKRYKRFYYHIQLHLSDGQQVMCKICNKTYSEIVCPSDEFSAGDLKKVERFPEEIILAKIKSEARKAMCKNE